MKEGRLGRWCPPPLHPREAQRHDEDRFDRRAVGQEPLGARDGHGSRGRRRCRPSVEASRWRGRKPGRQRPGRATGPRWRPRRRAFFRARQARGPRRSPASERSPACPEARAAPGSVASPSRHASSVSTGASHAASRPSRSAAGRRPTLAAFRTARNSSGAAGRPRPVDAADAANNPPEHPRSLDPRATPGPGDPVDPPAVPARRRQTLARSGPRAAHRAADRPQRPLRAAIAGLASASAKRAAAIRP